MNRTGATILLVTLVTLIAYGIFQLFRGNFGVMFATMPLLLFSWLFLSSRRPR